MDIIKFEKLIQEFSKLPKAEVVLPTYLEIAGQPHFENVCSNILAYFFNTNESHGLKDLVLKSFIECIDETLLLEYDIETINIERELYVDEQKRIDIVIECNDLVITIENKIYHILNNNLDLYEKSIKDNYPDKRYIFIVLSLKEENPKNKKFLPVTYEKFFYKLKQNLGAYFVNTNNQYTTFLIDFIQTIENLTKMKIHNDKFLDFYIQNKSEIDELIRENKNLNELLYNKVKSLSAILDDDKSTEAEINKVKFSKKWIWNKNTIVLEFYIEDRIVVVPIWFEFNLIRILLYVRKDSKKNIIEDDPILNRLYIQKDKPEFKRYKLDNNTSRRILLEKEIKFTDINDEEFVTQINQIISEIRVV